MITEDYVSLEVAKLLKEKGFREWCSYCYGTAVRHNGEDIDEDEEYELKAEGRGDEIEYVEGGHLYHFNCNNSKEDINIWACPTQSLATKWLREKGIYFSLVPFIENVGWPKDTWHINFYNSDGIMGGGFPVKGYKEAVEAAIRYCLENLI